MKRAFTFVEMLVVLVIIAGMMAMLFPAMHAARESAREAACLNNLHQLRLALLQHVDVHKDAPKPKNWTVALLPWLEEAVTIEALQNQDGNVPAPLVYLCPSHPGLGDRKANIQNIPPCYYSLVISRPTGRRKVRGVQVADRSTDLDTAEIAPWWTGPEISPAEFTKQTARFQGPHRGGHHHSISVRVGP
jgi:prepilin-type N-terminal cleavage/methylation domain-containing protein